MNRKKVVIFLLWYGAHSLCSRYEAARDFKSKRAQVWEFERNKRENEGKVGKVIHQRKSKKIVFGWVEMLDGEEENMFKESFEIPTFNFFRMSHFYTWDFVAFRRFSDSPITTMVMMMKVIRRNALDSVSKHIPFHSLDERSLSELRAH